MADDYQLDYNGTVIGDGTVWDVTNWGGLEEWTSRNTDVTIPSGWGALGGSAFVAARVAQVTVESVDPVAITLLEATLTPPPLSAPATLYPVRWKFPEREELVAYGRVSRRSRPRTITTALGLTSLAFELEFPDPRCYAYTPSTGTAPVYVAAATAWDLTASSGTNAGTDLAVDSGTGAGFDFVGTAGSGLVTVSNAGDVETYPVLTFTAANSAVNQWSLTNLTTGAVLTFSTTVAPGDVMIVDLRPASSTSTTVVPVTINGTAEYSAWVAPRTPMAFPPGESVLRLDQLSGSGTLTCGISWQSAYL